MTSLQKCLARALKFASLRSQVPWIRLLPGFRTGFNYLTAEINNIVEDIMTRKRADTGPVQNDLLQIILDANVADPIFFPEQRVREEIKLFMCISLQACQPLFDEKFLTGI
jgi:hypothetical protein